MRTLALIVFQFVFALLLLMASRAFAQDILNEDFEGTGEPSGWSHTGTVDYDNTSSPLEGTQSLVIDRTAGAHNQYASYDSGSEHDEFWAHIIYKPAALPSNYDYVFESNNSLGYSISVVFFIGRQTLYPKQWFQHLSSYRRINDRWSDLLH